MNGTSHSRGTTPAATRKQLAETPNATGKSSMYSEDYAVSFTVVLKSDSNRDILFFRGVWSHDVSAIFFLRKAGYVCGTIGPWVFGYCAMWTHRAIFGIKNCGHIVLGTYRAGQSYRAATGV